MGDRVTVFRGSVLYYRISPYGNAVVIARESDAHRVDAIRKAIKTAKTWGEFRAMLPAGEWDSIACSMDLDEDPAEDIEDSFGDTHPFNAERIPGFSDGDYPDWLTQRMLDILPKDILDKYAEISATIHSGNLCFIEEGHLQGIRRELEDRGFVLKDGSHLDYY